MKITLSELKQIIRQEVRNARLLREEKTKPSVEQLKNGNFVFTLSNGQKITLPKANFKVKMTVKDLLGSVKTWGNATDEKSLKVKLGSAKALKETRFLNSRAGRLLREEEELEMAQVNKNLIDELKNVLSGNYDRAIGGYVDDGEILLSSIKKTFQEIYPNDVGVSEYLSSINKLNSVTLEDYSVSYNDKWKDDIENAHDLPFTQKEKEEIIEDFESTYKEVNDGIREAQDRKTLRSVKIMGKLLYSYIANESYILETRFNDKNVALLLQGIIDQAHTISERKKRRFRNI